MVVSDGGNRLPGTLGRIGNSATWSWIPDRELPRGCPIWIATKQQGIVATFRVRDIVLDAVFDLPVRLLRPRTDWPNGRRAVRTTSGRVFDLASEGPFERFVTLSTFASPYGDGEFIDVQLDGGVRYCVRGNLDGSFDRVPTPDGVTFVEHNARGDVAVFAGLRRSPARRSAQKRGDRRSARRRRTLPFARTDDKPAMRKRRPSAEAAPSRPPRSSRSDDDGVHLASDRDCEHRQRRLVVHVGIQEGGRWRAVYPEAGARTPAAVKATVRRRRR